MKHSSLLYIGALLVSMALASCSEKAKPSVSSARSENKTPAPEAVENPADVRANESQSAFHLPALLMPGPLEPVPLDITDSTAQVPMLAVANIGRFASISQLRKSYFYKQFCSLYPELENINRIAVDTGVGDLWLFKPLLPNCSMAVREYNMQMFMQEQKESDGDVLFKTDIARPILVKASMDDPGSIIVDLDNREGRRLHWIPTQSPSDNELRFDEGITVLSYNVLENFAEMGADYTASVNEGLASLRFYADRQVRLDNRLMRYMSFHTADGKVGLYIKGLDLDGYFEVGGHKKDRESFTLTCKKGYDFGMGTNKTLTFKK